MMVWRETADGEVEAPHGMDAEGPVRCRTWRTEIVGERTFELTAYVGTDMWGHVVIFWECTAWHFGIAMERMTSGTRIYGDLPMRARSVKRLVATVSPVQVARYALWGELLASHRWTDGMGDMQP